MQRNVKLPLEIVYALDEILQPRDRQS